MASNPDHFLDALIGTTGLGPIQQLQQNQQNLQLGGQQQQLNAQSLQANQFALAGKQREEQEAQQYQTDVRAYFQNPTPQALAGLMAKYPKQADELSKAYQTMDAPARQSRISGLSSIYHAAKSNRPELVSTSLQRIVDAEKARGMDTTDAEGLIAEIAAGDPGAMQDALAFSQAQLSLADPAFAKSIGATAEDYTLSQGQTRFDSQNRPIASVAPKIEYQVIPEGGKLVPTNGPQGAEGGGQFAGGEESIPQGAGLVARLLPIVVANEGGGSLANPRTSPKGARGPMQVMPATNRDPGFGVKPAQDDSEAERARVGRDYLTAMVGRYSDPSKALAAYNAGPGRVDEAVRRAQELGTPEAWLTVRRKDGTQIMPAETRAYVNKGMAQLRGRGGSQAPRSGDPAGTIYGNPKRGWTTMTPDDVAANGLDAGVTYQRGPEGQIQPVSGSKPQRTRMTPQDVAAEGLNPDLAYYRDEQGMPQVVEGQRTTPLKTWPSTALTIHSENRSSIDRIDNALSLLDPKNKSPEALDARAAIGFGTGGFGLWDANRTNPRGSKFRSLIGQIGGIIIHDMSGAAVSLSEDARLRKWVPLDTDSPETITEKLHNLRSELSTRNRVMEDTYSEDQGYRPFGGGQSRPQGQRQPPRRTGKGSAPNNPVIVRSVQEAKRLPPGSWYVAPGGKLYHIPGGQ